jgi:DNA invertase Pin-like site-specific DNA recombinase
MPCASAPAAAAASWKVGPEAEVILAVMAWAAKMERLAINERIAAARERLAGEGRPWGRPPRLSGLLN